MYTRCSMYVPFGLHPDRRRRLEIELLMNPTTVLSATHKSSLPSLYIIE